jgi:2-polyprenyl-3-methyl-5-hydroxy-6-metoxy-1,4-benzoquinol methylase
VGTDRDWQKWGEQDPYFGVLSLEKFRRENLTEEHKAEFLRSGEEHIDSVFSNMREHVHAGFAPQRSLDFGCGVGRLVIPLARHCAESTGVDISEAMLAEAAANCAAAGIDNARFVLSDETLSRLQGEFDFMHSVVVFQHIPPPRGLALLARLLGHLAPGGAVALQFFHDTQASPLLRGLVHLRYRVPALNYARNVVRGRPMREPAMQLHCYPLPDLVATFKAAGIGALYLDCYDAFGFQGAMIYGRKQAAE